MQSLEINATVRDKVGTGPARLLRTQGLIPCIIYGVSIAPIAVSMSKKEAELLANRFSALTTVVNISTESGKYRALPKHIHLHPVTDVVEHIEFLIISDKELEIKVPLKIVGTDKSPGIKRGGVINITKCMVSPDKIPDVITIDISDMHIGTVVMLQDLNFPEGARPVDKNLTQTILRLSGRKAIQFEEAKTEGAAAEGATATAAPGAAPAAGAAGTPAAGADAKKGAADTKKPEAAAKKK